MIYVFWTVLILLILLIVFIVGCIGQVLRGIFAVYAWLLKGVFVILGIAYIIWMYNLNYDKAKKDYTNPHYYGTIYRITCPEVKNYWESKEHGTD